MTLKDIYTMLNSIEGFEDRVAYRMFPEGEGVGLPFITYLVTDTDNFMADGTVYLEICNVDIELYTSSKDLDSEALIETALKTNNISWNKTEYYLKDEHCYMITYSITIKGE